MKFLIGRWFPPEHVKGCWPDKVECAVPPLGPGEKSRAYYDLDSRGIEVRQAVIAAGIITRNRPELLKRTILSLQQSEYPISRIVVCDDSTDEATALMLAAEFPDVHWTEGPRRGRSANRNNVIRAAASEYVVVSDDDVLVDPHFIAKTMAQAVISPDGMFFTATGQDGQIILPLAMSFLGFWTKRYAPGEPYTTSNSHCFVLSKSVTERVAFDEIMDKYGTEEADFTYRVAAAGFPIHCIEGCVNMHLAPSLERSLQHDANRLYATFKRYAYVDHRVLAATAFVMVASAHHMLRSFQTNRWRGLIQALSNIRLATVVILKYRRSRGN